MAEVIAESDLTISIKGRLSVTILKPGGEADLDPETGKLIVNDPGLIRDQRGGDNIMCIAGKTALAASLVWSGIQDQSANLGVTSSTFLTPLWGAVGSGAGTVAATDTLLFSELGRQTVGNGAFTPATASISAQVIWLFYFPSPTVTWSVTEAGVFANGSSNAASAATAGSMIDHWAFTPTVTVPTTDTLILQASFTIG